MKKIINSKKAPAPIGPYNQAILSQGFLYTSGQIAINPESGQTEFDNIESETKLVMQNLEAILKAAELGFENVIKVSIFISDMNNFSQINEVYASYFNEENAPARETVQVAKLPKNANVEISLIAAENI